MLVHMLNVGLGILASLVAWIVVTKALRPRLLLGSDLQRLIRRDGSTVYRVEYRNPRIRRVEDVRVTVRLFMVIGGRGAAQRRRWIAIQIPVDDSYKPILGRQPLLIRLAAVVRRKPRLVQYPTLILEDLDDSRLKFHLDSDVPPVTDLLPFLQRTSATVELSVRCADGFSGTYRTHARLYEAEDVVTKDERAKLESSIEAQPDVSMAASTGNQDTTNENGESRRDETLLRRPRDSKDDSR
jgi:hypothetical protein